MTGAVDWATLVTLFGALVGGFVTGYWFSSQIRQTSDASEKRLQVEIVALKLEVTTLKAKIEADAKEHRG
jgi:hypothetical protein